MDERKRWLAGLDTSDVERVPTLEELSRRVTWTMECVVESTEAWLRALRVLEEVSSRVDELRARVACLERKLGELK